MILAVIAHADDRVSHGAAFDFVAAYQRLLVEDLDGVSWCRSMELINGRDVGSRFLRQRVVVVVLLVKGSGLVMNEVLVDFSRDPLHLHRAVD